MKSLVLIAAVLFPTVLPLCAAAELPRVVFLSVSDRGPEAEDVITIFEKHLKSMDIEVETTSHVMDKVPRGPSGWLRQAIKVSGAPGTVAAFGYICGKHKCNLFVMDPREKTYANLPVLVDDSEAGTSRAFAVAATARESLLGSMYPEMRRLVEEGRKPTVPESSRESAWLKPPVEEEPEPVRKPQRPWLWMDGGYFGDISHPDGHPIHGPWVGGRLEPVELVGVMLSIGWLGIQRAEEGMAEARIHRFVTSLSIPLILPLGPARISLAPTGRLDVAFTSVDNVDHADTQRASVEFQAGGVALWHLPLSEELNILVGAGLFVSVLGDETEVYVSENRRVTAIPSSTVRLEWLMGLAWSPVAGAASPSTARSSENSR